MAEIFQFAKSGSPTMLVQNLSEITDDIEYMLVVRIMKDKEIKFDWTAVPNNLHAIGAVELLKQEVLSWSEYP